MRKGDRWRDADRTGLTGRSLLQRSTSDELSLTALKSVPIANRVFSGTATTKDGSTAQNAASRVRDSLGKASPSSVRRRFRVTLRLTAVQPFLVVEIRCRSVSGAIEELTQSYRGHSLIKIEQWREAREGKWKLVV